MDSNNMNTPGSTGENNYQNNYQGNPQQPYQPLNQDSNLEEPVSMGEWLITFVILMVPCLNIVMMFVWAFGKNDKKSKSNYFKAMLIVWAISLVLGVVISILFGAALANAFS